MQVFVKTHEGRTLTFDADAGGKDTIRKVKEWIQQELDIPWTLQGLVFAGSILEDDRSLSDYNIQNETTLQLVVWETSSPSDMQVEGDTATLRNDRGEVVATFGLKTSSCAERMQAPTSFVAAASLQASQFQRFYKGTGRPRDVPTAEILSGLVRMGVFWRCDAGASLGALEFMDACGDTNRFSLDGQTLLYQTSNPCCPGGPVSSLGFDGHFLHLTLSGGGGPPWETLPRDPQVLINIRQLALLGAVPHSDPVLPEESAAASAVFQRLAEHYKLDEEHGAVKPYISDVSLVNHTFCEAVARGLASDDPVFLEAMAPYLIRLNKYLNDTHHSGGTLFAGANVPASSLSLLVPGTLMRVPGMLSASSQRSVAERFKVNLLLIIHVPTGFWGARSTEGASDVPEEEETLFCPYSQFVVLSWDPAEQELVLAAVDKYFGTDVADPICYPADFYETLSSGERALLSDGF